MYNYIIVHDADTQATISININYIEEISKRDNGSLIVRDNGSLIVTDIGHRIKVKESVLEIAKKIADSTTL